MSDLTSSITRLEASLSTPIGSSFNLENQPDVVAQLLANSRSPNTRRAYKKDIFDFFQLVANHEPTRDLVLEFLHLEQTQAVQLVLGYKAKLIAQGLKEATVNRRLAAIKSLTALGRQVGVCNYTLEDIKGEKTKAYRDTTGVDKETFTKVLSIPDALKHTVYSQRSLIKGTRDYALLRLLWGNALRRGEISLTNICDFDAENNTLSILGKGRGTEREIIALSSQTAIAISEWLIARGTAQGNAPLRATQAPELNSGDAPLFIAVDNANYGRRLSGNGIYTIVDRICKKAGISKKMSPHRIRHSSITAALDATDGNIRKVQKLSRHANINTLMTYDDNRTNYQEEMSQLLDDLV
jgi:integrase/recombinase XerC